MYIMLIHFNALACPNFLRHDIIMIACRIATVIRILNFVIYTSSAGILLMLVNIIWSRDLNFAPPQKKEVRNNNKIWWYE
jgi:hypothetical protein